MKFFKKEVNESGSLLVYCDEPEAEYALVPMEEYNGYRNAIRIIRDRAKQEINKSKADKNGYTFLRAEHRRYAYESDEKAWLITLSTPHSTKLNYKNASFLIKRDLIDFYDFIDIALDDISNEKYYEPIDMLKDHRKYFIENRFDEYQKIQNELIKKRIKFLDAHHGNIAFEIQKISANHGQGVYEVSYWSTSTYEEGYNNES